MENWLEILNLVLLEIDELQLHGTSKLIAFLGITSMWDHITKFCSCKTFQKKRFYSEPGENKRAKKTVAKYSNKLQTFTFLGKLFQQIYKIFVSFFRRFNCFH